MGMSIWMFGRNNPPHDYFLRNVIYAGWCKEVSNRKCYAAFTLVFFSQFTNSYLMKM